MSFQRYVHEQKAIEQHQVASMRSLRKASETTESARAALVIPSDQDLLKAHESDDGRDGQLQETDPTERISQLAGTMRLRSLRERAAHIHQGQSDAPAVHEIDLEHSGTDQAESDKTAIDQLTTEGGAERIPPSATTLIATKRQFRRSGV